MAIAANTGAGARWTGADEDGNIGGCASGDVATYLSAASITNRRTGIGGCSRSGGGSINACGDADVFLRWAARCSSNRRFGSGDGRETEDCIRAASRHCTGDCSGVDCSAEAEGIGGVNRCSERGERVCTGDCIDSVDLNDVDEPVDGDDFTVAETFSA